MVKMEKEICQLYKVICVVQSLTNICVGSLKEEQVVVSKYSVLGIRVKETPTKPKKQYKGMRVESREEDWFIS